MKKVTQEQVKMIENLTVDRNWGLNWQSKWNILLAKLGLKPASEMHFSERVDGQNREYIEGMISELKKVCETLEISYWHKRRAGTQSGGKSRGDIYVHDFVIASSEENLNKIVKYFSRIDEIASVDFNYHYGVGIGFGFPESAVVWFAQNVGSGRPLALEFHEKIQNGEIDISGLEDAYCAAAFVVTEENYREELKTVQVWLDATKDVSPKIYEEVLRLGRERSF